MRNPMSLTPAAKWVAEQRERGVADRVCGTSSSLRPISGNPDLLTPKSMQHASTRWGASRNGVEPTAAATDLADRALVAWGDKVGHARTLGAVAVREGAGCGQGRAAASDC